MILIISIVWWVSLISLVWLLRSPIWERLIIFLFLLDRLFIRCIELMSSGIWRYSEECSPRFLAPLVSSGPFSYSFSSVVFHPQYLYHSVKSVWIVLVLAPSLCGKVDAIVYWYSSSVQWLSWWNSDDFNEKMISFDGIDGGFIYNFKKLNRSHNLKVCKMLD